jgi:spore coat polysaccharide biosynthesis predicted glycosyltransferase SpsG
MMKGLTDGAGVDGVTTAKGKYGTVSQKRPVFLGPELEILAEEFFEARAKRNQATLGELGLANDQERAVEIQVFQAKAGDLAHP